MKKSKGELNMLQHIKCACGVHIWYPQDIDFIRDNPAVTCPTCRAEYGTDPFPGIETGTKKGTIGGTETGKETDTGDAHAIRCRLLAEVEHRIAVEFSLHRISLITNGAHSTILAIVSESERRVLASIGRMRK